MGPDIQYLIIHLLKRACTCTWMLYYEPGTLEPVGNMLIDVLDKEYTPLVLCRIIPLVPYRMKYC